MPYALDIRLDGRLAVVVGGGPEAADQVAGLRAAGARVLVVADQLGDPLAGLAADGLIMTRRGAYQPGDLDGAWLVLACHEVPAVNAAVASDAAWRHLWCVGADAGPGTADPGPAAGRRVLVLGGARSGKSSTAEGFLGDRGDVEYVATGMPPGEQDPEWAARVAEHRRRRPPRWRTTETVDLERVLQSADPAPVLVDCLSLWLARVMDDCGAWDAGPAGESGSAVTGRVKGLLGAWRATSRPVVAVSNEVGCGVVPATASGRLYRDALGRLNAQVAAESDEVWFCTAGLPRRLR
ncbi:MAG TPA: bifunctional adenosylcobinamide kinase/adenosylcobinamide-phosphate guanylyltransferase [Trebonia sp.]